MTRSSFTRIAAVLFAGSVLALPLTAVAATSAPQGSSLHHKKPASSSAQVKAAQAALNKQGANLSVDGHMGPKTRDALKSFQTAHGLTVTGKLDKPTQAALKSL
ncbi:MAG TPA: peptidoglycan-binding domain-containing protein [Stellaceae bacterium]|nr:peptidoglycan-binding domain-containing protein [Stellaceae bacterium]